MKRQVAKLYHNGEWQVVKDSTQKVNPYRVYHVWYEPGDYGMRMRKKQVIRYADLASCIHYLYTIAAQNNKD